MFAWLQEESETGYISHKDITWTQKDNEDVLKLKSQFERFWHNNPEPVSLATGVATSEDIKADLQNVKANGQHFLWKFVTEQFINKSNSLNDIIPWRKSKTFGSLDII